MARLLQMVGVAPEAGAIEQSLGAREGSDFLGQARRYASSVGCSTTLSKVPVNELVSASLPALVQLWGDRVAVLERVDAAGGPFALWCAEADTAELTREEFSSVYSGLLLQVSRTRVLAERAAAVSDVRFERLLIDLGRVYEGTTTDCSFVLRNVGKADLELGLVRSICGCTRVSAEQTLVPAGRDACIRVSFDSTGRVGPQEQRIFVASSDPVSPLVQLRVAALVIPRTVVVSSRELDMRTSDGGGEDVREVYVTDPARAGMKVVGVATDSPCLTAQVTDVTEESGIPMYRVTVRTVSEAIAGDCNANVVIDTTHPKEQRVVIPVTIHRGTSVRVEPDVAAFGIVALGETPQVVVVATSDKPLMMLGVEAPDTLSVAIAQGEDRRHAIVTVGITHKAAKGLLLVTIRLLRADGDPVAIPVSGFVR